jgi:hypothetical protein
MVSPRKKVVICVLVNAVLAVLMGIMIVAFRDADSKYFRFGPQPDLIIISVLIDTWGKWSAAMFLLALFKAGDVLVNEVGTPVISFRVYNPDCLVISDFTKNELNVLANAMFIINAFKSIMIVVVSITQIDFAFANLFVSEIVSIFTVRWLISEKTFV